MIIIIIITLSIPNCALRSFVCALTSINQEKYKQNQTKSLDTSGYGYTFSAVATLFKAQHCVTFGRTFMVHNVKKWGSVEIVHKGKDKNVRNSWFVCYFSSTHS